MEKEPIIDANNNLLISRKNVKKSVFDIIKLKKGNYLDDFITKHKQDFVNFWVIFDDNKKTVNLQNIIWVKDYVLFTYSANSWLKKLANAINSDYILKNYNREQAIKLLEEFFVKAWYEIFYVLENAYSYDMLWEYWIV